MMRVPFVDLLAQYADIQGEVLPAVKGVMSRGQFILGEEVEIFEREFARYCEAEYCVGVSSGTEALHLALRALDVGPGDEVVTVANTFVATAFAISYVGATPVFVDVQASDYTMDVDLLGRALTRRTRAIIPVHLYGHPAEMDTILQVAAEYGLKVIEDACQAHGAEYKGRRVGSFGDVGCFSFYPGKNLGAYGDGGAVVTNSPEVAKRIRSLRNYAQPAKNVHNSVGFNSRLDTLQAAILLVKLRHLNRWNDQRRAAAAEYSKLLGGKNMVLPSENSDVRHVYHLYVVQHEARDELLEYLKGQGIVCGIHYPLPLSKQMPYRSAKTVPDGVPVSMDLSRKILSLPMFPELAKEHIRTVAEEVALFFRTGAATRDPR